jgi:hypothetical protein
MYLVNCFKTINEIFYLINENIKDLLTYTYLEADTYFKNALK